jgi:nitrate/TMAO reductase-like tetraheme cytochrome c subunit
MRVREFIISLTRNPISLSGAVIVTGSAILIITLLAVAIFGAEGSPYLGIITYLILPIFFLAGLLLIPWGVARERKRARRAEEAGEAAPAFPVIDLNSDRTRNWLLTFVGITAVNIIILATVTYKGVEYLDSVQFCGALCHVLQPEYTAYQISPHARVKCVECHIGPGASWFVKAKLSGVKELFATVFNTYPRPIPTPVHSLRPARATCEECHWPRKFIGTSPRVIPSHRNDSTNTALYTVLMLKVGGQEGGVSRGIHWHVDPVNQIRYRSDRSRENIVEVELDLPDGSVKRFLSEAADGQQGSNSEEATVWRVMDCMDCHNRPTHIYYSPERAVDLAIQRGEIPAELPFVRREAIKALQVSYPSHEEARAGIADTIYAFYRESFPQIAESHAELIEAATLTLGRIYTTNVFPSMRVTWGTYPEHIGHPDFMGGCFRCHAGKLRTESGATISQDCNTCHLVVAWNEESPEILKTLQP